MPYTKQSLSDLGLKRLKEIYERIIAHKSALPDEDAKMGDLVKKREQLARNANRKDLIFDKITYGGKTKQEKKKFLIKEIENVQNSLFIGKYSGYDTNAYKGKKSFDYEKNIDKIDPASGHETEDINQELETKTATEVAPTTEPTEKPYPELPTTKTEEEIKIKAQKKMAANFRNKKKARFDEDVDHFKELKEYLSAGLFGLSEFVGLTGDKSKKIITANDATEAQKEMLSTILQMYNNVDRKDKNQLNTLKEIIKTFGESVATQAANDEYTRQESDDMIRGLEGLKPLEKKVGGKDIDPIINRIIDKRDYKPAVGTQSQGSKEMFVKPEQKPLEPFGGLPSQNEVEAPYLSTKSDKAIGDVRQVGFIGAQDQLAKVEDVTLEPSERSKSLKRFTNFRWVQSVQNSDLGYASPFQRMDDIDDRRRFGKCFMHGNKMPKDADTQDELDKAKGFNTYSLVPSFDMSSRMQPATPLSFINSTSKFARKLTKDEMEPINQGKRNVNNVKNHLEFPSLLFNDDPLIKIRDKYKNNIVC